jgi:Flp pilus assembly protein protease CpaA
MADFFASGRIADLILVIMALECVGLVAYRRLTQRGVPASLFALNLLSGFCLALALRCALTGAWWGWIGASLAMAGIAHVLDLTMRWNRPAL